MARYIINGGKTLHGTIRVHGAKNAVLPLFAGSILTEDQTIISNCPNLSDVQNMGKILTHLGADLIREGSNVFIDAKNLTSYEIPCKLAKEIRSSVFLLGSVLSRMKKAIIPYPGGCDIGARPIDLHIKALRDLNCEVEESYGYILCDSTNLKPREISLSYPSVGATENVMLLTAISSGVTVLNNSAEEPEIEELQSFLNQMGARIEGAGTSQIRIEGVKKLSGTAYEAMPDRIVAGTYLTMVASAGGSVLLKGVNPKHIAPVIQLLRDAGASIIECGDSLKIYSRGRLNAFGEITTEPYPGFPTDMQAQISALATIAKGKTVINENIFETRFKYVPELIKMGAKIEIENGRTAVISGVDSLCGASVNAMDLRGGASLVVAGLSANGITEINAVEHIKRGYENLLCTLKSIGASITELS